MAFLDTNSKSKEIAAQDNTETNIVDQENVQRDLIITEIETSDGNLGASLR